MKDTDLSKGVHQQEWANPPANNSGQPEPSGGPVIGDSED